MFKWKVSGLGGVGSSKKSNKSESKLNNENCNNEQEAKNNNKNLNSSKTASPKKDQQQPQLEATNNNHNQPPSPQKPATGFRLFQSSNTNGILKNSANSADNTMSRVGQRLAMPAGVNQHPVSPNGRQSPNMSSEQVRPPSKPGWRPPKASEAAEEAIPSDSLYNGGQQQQQNGSTSWREKQFGSRPSLNGMAHWSSHGYLAKANENTGPQNNPGMSSPGSGDGYVVLRKQGDQMVTSTGSAAVTGPQSLPVNNVQGGERKYYSVKGYDSMVMANNDKYLTMDARYHSLKNLPPDIRARLRENLRQAHQENPGYHHNHQQPAPAPKPLHLQQQQQQHLPQFAPPPPPRNERKPGAETGKSSVSWHEWTQQLQAYIAWVNSQLRKRPELRPVQDLRTDLQSGEVLAQLIEIISGEKLAGIQYAPESLQGMRENIDRILQFMSAKRIRMHQITSKEVLEGNLKAVMRLILALAAHYKPQSVRHHDVSSNFDKISNEKIIPPAVEETTLNQTQDDLHAEDTSSPPKALKRSPSMSNHQHETTAQIYENFTSSRQQPMAMKQQQSSAADNVNKQLTSRENSFVNKMPSRENSFVNNKMPSRENSFVRTGSGRKLPKLPKPEDSILNTSLPIPQKRTLLEVSEEEKLENRKSKPKALEFWESLETLETRPGAQVQAAVQDNSSFRYNTIHRMSVGRRMLPKAPEIRSHSLDRGGSLNSSFSEEHKSHQENQDKSSRSPSPPGKVKMDLQPSPPASSDSRGEVEGSSDNNSPPTSVIQGKLQMNDWNNPAYDWVRGGANFQQRLGDGHSDGKHSDTMSDNIPYDILLQDLTQAKRQLLELHNLECVNLEGSKNGLQSRLAEQEMASSQLKQDLVRATLAKQTLEYEKKELLRRVDDLERGLSGIKNESNEKDKLIRTHKAQIEELARKQRDFSLAASAAGLTPNGETDLKALYDEELAVAKDAISNLRSSFNGSDPNQHILDTLEQCISVIIEKIQRLDYESKNGSRSSADNYQKSNSEGHISNVTTKILYFTNRSATPFMSTLNKSIGDITLRDFKAIFDRPGYYRFHFKSVDQEFGMVKEEIANDDSILPGESGKIVAWVEED